MIRNPREKAPSTKEEEATRGDGTAARWAPSAHPAALHEGRVVRGARANGGKDRHSKVTTARGLRDRRVRLSVQTAIQLYDIQDRLGLSQPSKAVDWLLSAAQHEIEKLPPLRVPPGSSLLYQPPHASPQLSSLDKDDNPYPAYTIMEPPPAPTLFYRQGSLPPPAPAPAPPLGLSHGSQFLLSMFSPFNPGPSDYDPRGGNSGFDVGSSSSSQGPKHRHF
ncbi:uncharacterized protein LOC144702142 [Wolffia australiana]